MECVPGRHHFIEHGKKPGTFECSMCHTDFPCKDTACGHDDCFGIRGGKCAICNKKTVDDWIVFTKKRTTRRAHLTCFQLEGKWTGAMKGGVRDATQTMSQTIGEKNASPAMEVMEEAKSP